MAVSSIVTSALLQMTQSQTTIWNRTEMHSGIRGATELLQQEVGQAGRVTLPGHGDAGEAVNAARRRSPCGSGNLRSGHADSARSGGRRDHERSR